MSDGWGVQSIKVFGGEVKARCLYLIPGKTDLLQMKWKGNLVDHPDLSALLEKASDYIADQMPVISMETEK